MSAAGGAAGRLARYGLFGALHGLVSAATGLLISATAYRVLAIDFGAYALVAGGMVRFNLLEDSLGQFLVTAGARRRRDGTTAVTAELAAALSVAAASLLLLAGLVAAGVAALYAGRGDQAVLAALAGGGLIASGLASAAGRLLEGEEDYARLRALQSGAALLRLGGVVALAALGVATVVSLLALQVASHGLLASACGALAWRRLGASTPWRLERGALASVWRFVRPLLTAKGVAILSYRLDLWIVQALWGPAATAAYAVAETIGNLLNQVLEVFKVLLPVTVRYWRDQDPASNRRLVLGASKACLLVVGGVCVVLLAALEPLLVFGFGSVSADAVAATRLLIGFAALTSLRSAVQTVLVARGRFGSVERAFVGGGLVNVGATVLATTWFPWGPALGTVAAGVVLLALVVPRAEAALALPGLRLQRDLVWPGLLSLTAGALCATLPLDAPLRASCALAAFVAAHALLVLEASDRTWLRERVRELGR